MSYSLQLSLCNTLQVKLKTGGSCCQLTRVAQLSPAFALSAGLYIYGSVGSGKSLLMDMFYTTLSKHNLVPQKRRMHFNAAMLEVSIALLYCLVVLA